MKLERIEKATPTSPSSESIPRGEKSGQIRVNPGQTRVIKSRPGSQPKSENGPGSLDPPFFTRATALGTTENRPGELGNIHYGPSNTIN